MMDGCPLQDLRFARHEGCQGWIGTTTRLIGSSTMSFEGGSLRRTSAGSLWLLCPQFSQLCFPRSPMSSRFCPSLTLLGSFGRAASYANGSVRGAASPSSSGAASSAITVGSPRNASTARSQSTHSLESHGTRVVQSRLGKRTPLYRHQEAPGQQEKRIPEGGERRFPVVSLVCSPACGDSFRQSTAEAVEICSRKGTPELTRRPAC
jgi:hypothetical protein